MSVGNMSTLSEMSFTPKLIIASSDFYFYLLLTNMCPSNQPDNVFPALFSQQKRATLFRQLWIWLAESQRELGLEEITSEMVAEMKANREDIRWDDIAERERKAKHDVMAHIGAFGEVCPLAKGIIHLGVTSCFVQDNADLIIQREALDHLIKSLTTCLKDLANFVAENSGLPTVGRAIFHEPSLTTVGRRAANWADGFLDALKNFRRVRAELRFRGVKGAVGTQDALVDLFSTIDYATAKERATRLDAMVAQKAGFDGKLFNVCGQTYPRYQDSNVVYALSLFGSAAAKFANDFCILQELGEMSESSLDTEDQVVRSSATMVLTQQILGHSTKLMSYVLSPLKTFADQGLERIGRLGHPTNCAVGLISDRGCNSVQTAACVHGNVCSQSCVCQSASGSEFFSEKRRSGLKSQNHGTVTTTPSPQNNGIKNSANQNMCHFLTAITKTINLLNFNLVIKQKCFRLSSGHCIRSQNRKHKFVELVVKKPQKRFLLPTGPFQQIMDNWTTKKQWRYVDRPGVLAFMQKLHPLFTACRRGINVSFYMDGEPSISQFIMTQIWPMLNENVHALKFEQPNDLQLLRDVAPSVLADCPKLRIVSTIGNAFPEMPANDSATGSDGQAMSKWRLAPCSADDAPKILIISARQRSWQRNSNN